MVRMFRQSLGEKRKEVAACCCKTTDTEIFSNKKKNNWFLEIFKFGSLDICGSFSVKSVKATGVFELAFFGTALVQNTFGGLILFHSIAVYTTYITIYINKWQMSVYLHCIYTVYVMILYPSFPSNKSNSFHPLIGISDMFCKKERSLYCFLTGLESWTNPSGPNATKLGNGSCWWRLNREPRARVTWGWGHRRDQQPSNYRIHLQKIFDSWLWGINPGETWSL